jgi:hypothetical protein
VDTKRDLDARKKGEFQSTDIIPSLVLYLHRFDQARGLPGNGGRTRNLLHLYMMQKRAALAEYAGAVVLKQTLDAINTRFKTAKARAEAMPAGPARDELVKRCAGMALAAGRVALELRRLEKDAQTLKNN